jgi:uncharacterized protein (TIGR03083 family)
METLMSSDARTSIAVLRNSHERLVSLVQPLSPEHLRAQSYDTEWSIAQVLSHIGSGAEIATLSLAAALGERGDLDRDAFPAIWDTWNNRTPEAQAADSLTWDEEHISRLERLTDDELDALSLDFIGVQLDAAGAVRLRLGEHVIHVWDVAVSIDPGATLSAESVPLVLDHIQLLLRFIAKPEGDSFRVRLQTTEPEGDYLLDVGESVTLSGWAPGLEADGVIRLPAEAMLRLFYGRLDPEHTPAYSAEGIDLDRVRKVFPGF